MAFGRTDQPRIVFCFLCVLTRTTQKKTEKTTMSRKHRTLALTREPLCGKDKNDITAAGCCCWCCCWLAGLLYHTGTAWRQLDEDKVPIETTIIINLMWLRFSCSRAVLFSKKNAKMLKKNKP